MNTEKGYKRVVFWFVLPREERKRSDDRRICRPFLLLKQSRSIRDIFLIRLLSVLEREWVVGYLRRRRRHNIYD